MLKNTFAPLLACPACGYKIITVSDNRKKKKGFAHNLELLCKSCDWCKSIYTLKGMC